MKNFRTVNNKRGFTIVELLIVIAIIGILATITVIGYGAWRHSVLVASVKSDLNGVASAMESEANYNDTYPADIPATFSPSDNVTLSGGGDVGGSTYCVDGVSAEDDTINFYISSETKDAGAVEGTCASRTASNVPATPTGLTAVSSTLTQVNLSWTSSPTATSYTEQCASDTAFVSGLQQASQSNSTGTVSGLAEQTTVYCRVRATNSFGNSGWSAVVSTATATPDACPVAPSAPGFISAATTSSSVLSITWASVTCQDSYTIDRSLSGTFSSGITSVSQSGAGTTYSSTGLSPGLTYYYRVKAVNTHGSSSWSSTASAVTTPSAPTGLSLVVDSRIQITASWNAVASATSYDLDYSTSSIFSSYSTVNTTNLSQAVTGLTDGTVYYFRVRANIGAVSSASSTAVSATTTSVVLSGQSSCSSTYSARPNYRIDLVWTEVSYNIAANTSNVTWVGYRTPNVYVSVGTYDQSAAAADWTYAVDLNGASVASGYSNSGRWRGRAANVGNTEAFWGTNTTTNSSYSGTATITHDADGTKTIATHVRDSYGGIFGTAECSGSYVLSDLR